MELTLLKRMSDGRFAVELSFVYGVPSLHQWADKFAKWFGGRIEGSHSSSQGEWIEVLLLGKKFYLVQVPRRETWLIAGDVGANQALAELEEEIQFSLGRVGGYDRRWPSEIDNVTEIWGVHEQSILAACKAEDKS